MLLRFMMLSLVIFGLLLVLATPWVIVWDSWRNSDRDNNGIVVIVCVGLCIGEVLGAIDWLIGW